ncbi:hypothetical protein K1719_044407 [Acacia pycnantha]|nr:hypothetical protein K1719_044407 [Acacia pycnantha]
MLRSTCNLDKLEHLDFEENNFNGPFPSHIFNISALTYVSLALNSFSSFLPSNLGIGHPNLKSLQLGQNQLIGKIPNSISNASELTVLDLSGNKFSDSIPNVLGNLTNLMALNFHGNALNGLIPNTINKLQSLQLLSLSNNRLQGPVINELCQIKSLSELHLANNMFSGTIPSCFTSTYLRKLDLSSNKLISQIPSSLWSLQDILVLDLSSNALSGRIPPEVSNLKAIILLNLSRNQIVGNIPTTLGGLQTLLNLSLAHNKLQGPIPESLGGMVSLESLDLSKNYMRCDSEIIGVTSLSKYINLSYNLLQGEIPNGGCIENFSADSFMMNEGLCGKPQLLVQPCRKGKKHNSSKVMLLIECSLPILAVLLVGRGSFGSIYKAVLPNGKIVAVKVFSSSVERALNSFENECAALYSLRHRNLTKMISDYSHGEFKSIIMEFMSNGSLHKWLHSNNYYLDTLQRLNIVIDVAIALEYLHHGSPTPIVHCDIKPSNILLDEDMVTHLGDFGIAKLLGENQMEIYTKTLATIDYMAPDANLLPRDDQNADIILSHISALLELALHCCVDLPGARINMKDVVVKLNKIKISFIKNVSDTTNYLNNC